MTTENPPIKLVLFNKPYSVHSQFRRDNDKMRTLADYFDDKSLRVVGRLDADSEGLLLLTDCGALNHAIASPPKATKGNKQPKRYLVQVEGTPSTEQLQALSRGVELKDDKTLPAQVALLSDDKLPIPLWARNPPIRERKSIPTAWLMLTIYEGKNRQVRRMSAHVGLPCLRLIRYAVAGFNLSLDGLDDLGDMRGWEMLASGDSVCLHLSRAELRAFGIDLPKGNLTKSNANQAKQGKRPNQKPAQFAKAKQAQKAKSLSKPKGTKLKSKPT